MCLTIDGESDHYDVRYSNLFPHPFRIILLPLLFLSDRFLREQFLQVVVRSDQSVEHGNESACRMHISQLMFVTV